MLRLTLLEILRSHPSGPLSSPLPRPDSSASSCLRRARRMLGCEVESWRRPPGGCFESTTVLLARRSLMQCVRLTHAPSASRASSQWRRAGEAAPGRQQPFPRRDPFSHYPRRRRRLVPIAASCSLTTTLTSLHSCNGHRRHKNIAHRIASWPTRQAQDRSLSHCPPFLLTHSAKAEILLASPWPLALLHPLFRIPIASSRTMERHQRQQVAVHRHH